MFFFFRAISTSSARYADGSESWLSKLLVRKIEPTKESHSRMLSDKDTIFALHTHNVKPSAIDDYLLN